MEPYKAEKRTYAKPRILRVQLDHEQAVLSACEVGVTNILSNLNFSCNAGKNCKRWQDTKGNFAATS